MAPKPAWQRWDDDPLAAATGISFNRTPQDEIRAPQGKLRVCAYHIDFDERPVCFVDVTNLAEAQRIIDDLHKLCGFNVDYALAYDDAGQRIGKPPW
jgi:hypothetical protein